MSRRFVVALAVAVIATMGGCAPTVRTVSGPDGRPAYFVSCVDESCLKSAYATCPSGYTIVAGQSGVNGSRDMTFRCRGASNNPLASR